MGAPVVAAEAAGAARAVATGAKTAQGARGGAAAKGTRRPSGSSTRRSAAGRRTPAGDRQREGIQQIKDSRPKDRTPADGHVLAEVPVGQEPAPAPATQPAAPREPSRVSVEAVSAASTGGGFVLGAIVWAVGVNYLRGGMPQVKRLLRAKFLNKVG